MRSLLLCIGMVLWGGAALAQSPVAAPTGAAKERMGGPFGLGVSVGAPTGLTGKAWLGDKGAVQFTVGGDLGRIGDLAVTADYVYHVRPFVTDAEVYSLPLYFGAGLNLGSNTYELDGSLMVGPRVVTGVSLVLTELPIDFFVEVAPTLYLVESVSWSVDGALGVRYYF